MILLFFIVSTMQRKNYAVGRLNFILTLDQSIAWYDSLPANLLVEHDITQPRFSLLFEITEFISPLNLLRVCKLPVVDLS